MTTKDWKEGFKAVYPVCIGYIPIGLACGVLLQQSGYNWFFVLLISVFVYGGASQFLIASMTISGAGIFEIIAMVFFINLRHILMSSSLAQKIKDKDLPFSLIFAQTITDESFAVNTLEFKKNGEWSPNKALAANILPFITWAASTVTGAAAGNIISVSPVIMNYLLLAMFIFLLVLQIENRIVLWTAVFSGLLSVILMAVLRNSISVVITSIVASFFGLFLQNRKDKKEGLLHE